MQRFEFGLDDHHQVGHDQIIPPITQTGSPFRSDEAKRRTELRAINYFDSLALLFKVYVTWKLILLASESHSEHC